MSAEQAMRDLDSYADLKQGWDSYGAPPVAAEAIRTAKALIASIGVTPTVQGGVEIYMASEAVAIEVNKQGSVVSMCVDSEAVEDYMTPRVRVEEANRAQA